MQQFETLQCEERDRVLIVWLNRPPGNALNPRVFAELHSIFSMAERWPRDIRAVVLAARGKNFCVGADFKALKNRNAANAYYIQQNARKGLWAIYDCKLPVIGAIQGAAVGGGTALAAVCDVVVAARGARFGMPEIKVGVAGGASFMKKFIPQPICRWLFLTGELIEAERLLQFGSVLDVVDESLLLERALEVCQKMVRHSPLSIRMAKESLNSTEFKSLKDGYEFEQGFTGMLYSHPDGVEAANAFAEKRMGNFQPFKADFPDLDQTDEPVL